MGEWAGLPMPMTGNPMVVNPSYPWAEGLMKIGAVETEEDAEEAAFAKGLTLRNTFWSWQKRSWVHVWEKGGKIEWGIKPAANHFLLDLKTVGAADAWGMQQEEAAVELLSSLLAPRIFSQYLMTGMFLERSKRSGIHYMFRRLKPTVAFTESGGRGRSRERRGGGHMRILCAMCMHPIAYYQGTWAGAMCPTDDVLAHLMMMRGDEAMFWRRCNQHAAFEPEAGI